MNNAETFLSYSWKDLKIADEIDNDFKAIGVDLIRDVRDLPAYGNIEKFMEKVKESDYVIMLISDSFLKSTNCMSEMLNLRRTGNFTNRLIPILLDVKKILKNKEINKISYQKYWKKQHERLKNEIESLDHEDIKANIDDLNKYQRIKNYIGEFISIIQNKNCVDHEELKKTNYKAILEKIGYDNPALKSELLRIVRIEKEEDQDIEIEILIEKFPNFYYALFVRGLIERDRKKFKKSMFYFNKFIELNQEFDRAFFNRGFVYGINGDYDKAIQDFTKAIELNPNLVNAFNNRGIAFSEKGEHKKAIQDFNKAIDLNPEYYEVYINRGLAFSKKGEHDKAIQDFINAIELNPKSAKSYYYLGFEYFYLKKYDEANKKCNQAIKLNSKLAEAYLLKGIIYSLKRKYDTAKKYFSKAKKANPQMAEFGVKDYPGSPEEKELLIKYIKEGLPVNMIEKKTGLPKHIISEKLKLYNIR